MIAIEAVRSMARNLVRIERQTPSQGVVSYARAQDDYRLALQHFHEAPIADPIDPNSIASHGYHINQLSKGERAIKRGPVIGTDLVLLSSVRLRLRNEAISKGTSLDRPQEPEPSLENVGQRSFHHE